MNQKMNEFLHIKFGNDSWNNSLFLLFFLFLLSIKIYIIYLHSVTLKLLTDNNCLLMLFGVLRSFDTVQVISGAVS